MMRCGMLAAAMAAAGHAAAQETAPNDILPELAWPIYESADEDLDTCALGEVAGLDSNGDGFVSVRRGPGTTYERIAKLKNGDRVWVFDEVESWFGVIYGAATVECSAIPETRVLNRDGALQGWVYGKWIKPLAG